MTKITFTSGSLKGQSVDFNPGSEYSVGRSHKCDLRCAESDVSRCHVRLSAEPDGVVSMSVESEFGAERNGVKLEKGTTVKLQIGDEVRIGKSLAFAVEQKSEPPGDGRTVVPQFEVTDTQISSTGFIGGQTMVPQGTAAATRPQDTDGGTVAGGETVALGTIAGDDEAFEKIKLEGRVRRRNRLLAWIVPLALAFVGLVAAYIALRPAPEVYTSWPQDGNGQFLNKFVLVESFLAVCVPNVPAFESADLKTGKRVVSALGRDRDIPLTVTVERMESRSLLEMDHDEAFEAYLANRRETDTMFATGANRIRKFLCVTSGAGVPVSYVDYTRRSGGDEYFGYLLYLRRADVAYAFDIEIPLAARWRAERFLAESLDSIGLYAPKRVPEHWEGGRWFRAGTSISRDLDEARSYLERSKSPMNWEKGLYCLKSVLIKGTKKGDAESVKQAEDMLVKLRARQSDWYNTCKLGYLQAKVADDKERMQALQSMCESVFTAQFQDCDYRYERIKRKDWH